MTHRMQAIKGDITKIETDAIVNAANSSLMGGGGVDGAIHRAGGPAILDACRDIVARQGSLETGNAVITTAGNLPAKFVIHTVGPVWRGGSNNEPALLAACYKNSLRIAAEHQLASIAFPAISTGIYGYPKQEATNIAIDTVGAFLQGNTAIERVVFVCFDEESFSLYQKQLPTS